MHKAIGYIRVSTETQASEGVSLGAQKARIEAWCLANDVLLVECFVDAGLSGCRADNRPELQAALQAAVGCKGVFIVYSLSRLARSTKDTIVISERLDKAGCDLVSLSEKIDTTSAAGKMVFRMLAVMAEFERDLVSERTKAALTHKRSLGLRIGGIPFGWILSTDGKSLIEDPLEQDALKLIQVLRSEGNSLRKIVTELECRSVSTKAGKKKWSAKAIRGILIRNSTTIES